MSSALPEVVATAEVIGILRGCAGKLGLSAQVLRSLELLLSFLPPKRNHHMVFASNETLVHRAQGLHERSLRRHIAALTEAGFLQRADSPNRKRYSCHDPRAGLTMRFGLDLSPLFARLPDLRLIAEEAEAEARQIGYLRRKLRAAAARLMALDPADLRASEILNLARRKLTAEQLAGIAAELPCPIETEAPSEQLILSGSGGQNDRHHPNLNKELIEKNETEVIGRIAEKMPEALSYALTPIRSIDDIEEHGRFLAPMLGITPKLYQEAMEAQSRWSVTSLIWMIVEDAARISRPAAYFRALTLGAKAASYRAWEWLSRPGPNCPRTI